MTQPCNKALQNSTTCAPPTHTLAHSAQVYIHDCLSDVGDDAMSVKSYGNIFDPSKPSPAVNILFERVTIVSRNFAIGGSVSAGVNQVLYNLPAPVLFVCASS